MDKPKLLYASPFPPQQSGISDYSVVLVKALAEKFDITLYTEKYDIEEPSLSCYPVIKYGIDPIDFDAYPYRVYNIGNNPWFHQFIYKAALEHPGLVILHDFIIYYLFVGYHAEKNDIYSSVYHFEGLNAYTLVKNAVKDSRESLLEQKHLAPELPLNRELLASGNKIMVHSQYAFDKVMETGLVPLEKVRKINIIKQIDKNSRLIDREVLFSKYSVPKDAMIISSFGYIGTTKLNKEVCQAIKKIQNQVSKKICYLMVGEGTYTDEELEENLIIKTGYTEIDEFNSFVYYSDIVINLRNPSMGETSGAMLRILQAGKPCITNNGGWFSELPEESVYKIELDDIESNLERAILYLIENEEERNRLRKSAEQYTEEEYSENKIVQQIFDFLVKE